jgi:hypothetical protein
MARPLRIEYEYHIISRGNRAKYIEAKNKVEAVGGSGFALWYL